MSNLFDPKLLNPASKFKIFMAKLFGKKTVGVDYSEEEDFGMEMTGYKYKGVLYITKSEKITRRRK